MAIAQNKLCSLFSAGVSSCKNILQLSVDGVYPEKSPGALSQSWPLIGQCSWQRPLIGWAIPLRIQFVTLSECCKGIHINIAEDQTILKFAKFKNFIFNQMWWSNQRPVFRSRDVSRPHIHLDVTWRNLCSYDSETSKHSESNFIFFEISSSSCPIGNLCCRDQTTKKSKCAL